MGGVAVAPRGETALDASTAATYTPGRNVMGMTAVEKILCELIALPSVNPAFLPPKDPHAGERSVAEFLAATAAAVGLDVELQEVLPGRSNLIVRCSPAGRSRRRVVLAPHLDTVGGDLTAIFRPRTQVGRIHGRGACDTKGSVAAMLCALMEVARARVRPRETEIVLAGLIDEENFQAGSRALVAGGLRADLAIVGEPTQLKVVTAHKGDLWLRIETRGRAAHGARPELGRNAVHAMARIVELLETEYAAALHRRSHPVLGRPTVNVGSICGGTQPNIVPDRCEISVDRRTIPGETEAGVRREIRSLLRRRGHPALLLTIRTAPCPPLETPPGLPLVQGLMRTVGQRGPLGVDYFCDAAVLAAGGIPSVVFGPGDIAQAHTADEWISRAQLNRAAVLLSKFLRSLP